MKTLQDILNRTTLEGKQLIKRASKKALGLQWIEHSNELAGAKLLAYANKLPKGQVKTRLTFVANFFVAHPEMCYPDYIDYFDNVKGWKNDLASKYSMLECFRDDPYLIKLYKKYDPTVSEWS